MKMNHTNFKHFKSGSTESVYYVLDGKKVVPAKSGLDWGRWMHNNLTKQSIKMSEINDQFMVSTVFIGVQNCIFESMIYDKDGGELDYYFIRTESYELALEAHNELLGMINTPSDAFD